MDARRSLVISGISLALVFASFVLSLPPSSVAINYNQVTFTPTDHEYLPIIINGADPALILTNTSTPGETSTPEPTETPTSVPPNEPLPLEDVAYWAYQLQYISEPGAVETLVASPYDMLVLEPTCTDWSWDDRYFDTQGMVTQLKDSQASDGVHRKRVMAYIAIGEAEEWRWYWTWSKGWDCQGQPPADWPDYILACDPDGWAGDYPVAYWDEDWKDVVIYGHNQGSHPDRDYNSMIDEALKHGFDGIYLDWVEGFEDEEVVAAAQAAGKDPAVEMITFIQEMRDYALARNPDFLIVQQNAATLSDGHPELFNVIDAIAQESIWYGGRAADDWDDPNGYDRPNSSELVNYYIGYLDQYLAAGLLVFNCEYALEYADTAYANALNKGYAPYVTRTPLSQLTTTPPWLYFGLTISGPAPPPTKLHFSRFL